MTQTLWIWSKRNQWWNNGKFKITGDVISCYPFYKIQKMYYQDTGFILCKDSLLWPSQIRVEPEWKPYTPEEVIGILDTK